MSRFTQYSEDACRLPEGFQRIAYDADTERYTFRDRKGALYQSAPGQEYGKLTPVSDKRAESWRYDDQYKRPTISAESHGTSFHDILPSYAITSASPPSSASSGSQENLEISPRSRFIEAAKRSTVPKMQGVVNNLRRSVTSARKPPPVPEKDSDTVGLLRSQSVLSWSSTVTVNGTIPMDEQKYKLE
ncbi:hypothetical protein BDP27DRAFT_1309491 [Rhodocollybia butyracea]|uniref:Uncharacterized protein n=1 Tax=Rhodocollybia butyracea TaxID=206335 RepID=A0A9P5UFJ7_9AGAR|nr:hypothetical protein BDP27DRAFT_1309491 [Rhodocollybia butyracea]